MESKGFYLVTSQPAPNASFSEEIKHYLGASKQLNSENYPSEIRNQCKDYMNSGINISVALLSDFHKPDLKTEFRQGPVICRLETPSPPKRAHPCPGAISIWRPVGGNLGPANGLFRVYPNSHHILTEKELLGSGIHALDIYIPSDQVLYTHGGLWVEQRSGDGLLMWMGVSSEIIGLHLDPQITLPLISEAYDNHVLPPVEEETQNQNAPSTLDAAPPSPNRVNHRGTRQHTGKKVLSHALEDLVVVKDFIAGISDPTGIILSACYGDPAPWETYLTAGRDLDPLRWFLRSLNIRYLVRRHFAGDMGDLDRRCCARAVQYGRIPSALEWQLRKPHIWIALMSVLSRFPHLPYSEVEPMVYLLQGEYKALVESNYWYKLAEDSHCLYTRHIDYLLRKGSSHALSPGIPHDR